MTIVFLGVIMVVVCYVVYRNRQDTNRVKETCLTEETAPAPAGKETCITEETAPAPAGSVSPQKSTRMNVRDLCIETLKELNCEVEFNEKVENRMYFTFQGEHFYIDVFDDSVFFTIWDTYWYRVSLDDLDNVSMVRKAINTVNVNYDNTVFYTIDEEDNRFDVHTKRSCLLLDEIPEKKAYMKAMLDTFFVTQRHFYSVIDQLQNEKKAQS